MKSRTRIYAHRMAAIQAGRRQTIESEEEPVTPFWELENSQLLREAKLWTQEQWDKNMREFPYNVDKTLAKKKMQILSKAMNSSSVLSASAIYHIINDMRYPGNNEKFYNITANSSGYTISMKYEQHWPYTRVS